MDFWKDPQKAVEVSIDMPVTKRGKQQLEHDMQGYFIGALKRRAVEVSENEWTPKPNKCLRLPNRLR